MTILWALVEAIAVYYVLFVNRLIDKFKVKKDNEIRAKISEIEAKEKIKDDVIDSEEKIHDEIEQTSVIKSQMLSGDKQKVTVENEIKDPLFDFDKDNKNRIITIFFLSAIAGFCAFHIKSWASNIDSIKLMILFVGSSIAMLVDRKTRLIPNSLIYSMLAIRLLILIAEFFIYPEIIKDVIIMNAIGGGVTFIIFAGLSLLSKGGIGMGDVKLLSVFGLFTGIGTVLFTMVYALVIATIYSILMIALKKLTIKDKLEFGPYIFIGLILAILFNTL